MSTCAMRPLLVGELNPYGTDPRYALYPEPERSAGGRLCRLVLGLSVKEYIKRYDRANLCVGVWSAPVARRAAAALTEGVEQRPAIVLLGRKVCDAFRISFIPFRVIRAGETHVGHWRSNVVVLPHPSGLCRAWNEPGSFERARVALRDAGVLTSE
jgi:hypothetical protein